MCGICGIVGFTDRAAINNMTTIVAHRGPDDFGIQVFDSNRVALGHRRLSILDLSAAGHQPMTDADGRFWITFNGEIYNYYAVRESLKSVGHSFKSNSDTEVLLYAYKEWGAGCLDRLNGMFAFAIWDEKTKRLFAARDRLGVKPFYYWCNNQHFAFASEIKSLFKSGLVDPEIDYKALHTPAMYQVAPNTGFRHIHKLPAGSFLTLDFSGGRTDPVVQRYWDITPSVTIEDLAAATDQMDGLLRDSVRGQMISDVPIGVLLSGGLDSSLLLALMARNTSERINTFTIKFSDSDKRHEQMADDSHYARMVAEMFQSDHNEIEIKPDIVDLLPKMMWHLDEPLADPAAINTFLISRAARERGISVLLNGTGADEIFGGYRKYLACLLADRYQCFVPELGRELFSRVVRHLPTATSGRGFRSIRWAKRFLSFAGLPEFERFLGSSSLPAAEFDGLFAKNIANGDRLQDTYFAKRQREVLEQKELPYIVRMCLTDTATYLPDHNLLYSDKCSMAAGIEGRPPFTDHRIAEFMFSTHPNLRIKGSQQKVLLKNLATRYLPRNIVYRPKAPFGAPLRAWMRGGLSEMVRDYLSPSGLKQRGIYDASYVSKKIQNDAAGLEDNSHLIWTLLCNEIWFRTFFDKPL